MCGIAGFFDNRISTDESRVRIQSMLKVIEHRGPEASQFYSNSGFVLGHNRLKIIDLSDEANQPFYYNNLVLVFNGEVYNYIELKLELQKLGYTFSTASDTEVVCAAYLAWGQNCVNRFMGMWAFALYDTQKKLLFCSRDRFGIKPFHYFEIAGSLYFASEIKALKVLPFFPNEINEQQIIRGLQAGQVCFKEQTFFKNVKLLPPGSNLIIENNSAKIYSYYQLPLQNKSSLNRDEKKQRFFELFKQSVALHSRSDVKNGICLSGGLDSSAIASMFGSLFPQTSIKSFTIYYEGIGAVDERPFVHEVIKKYPTIQSFTFSPTDVDVANSFERCIYHAEAPLLGSTYMSQYFLMQLAAKEGVTVVLDGQGSDEYLAGYLHSFPRMLCVLLQKGRLFDYIKVLRQLKKREKQSLTAVFKNVALSTLLGFQNEQFIQNLEMTQGLDSYSTLKYLPLENESFSDEIFDNFLVNLMFHTTLPTLLHFEDKNSMAFSLESRVPFLDHRLVEFGFELSLEDRISLQAETKWVLREGLKPVLPKAVYERKDKKGFVTPGEVRWLNGPLKFLLDQPLKTGVFKKSEVNKLISNYRHGNTSVAKKLWRILNTEYWLNRV